MYRTGGADHFKAREYKGFDLMDTAFRMVKWNPKVIEKEIRCRFQEMQIPVPHSWPELADFICSRKGISLASMILLVICWSSDFFTNYLNPDGYLQLHLHLEEGFSVEQQRSGNLQPLKITLMSTCLTI